MQSTTEKAKPMLHATSCLQPASSSRSLTPYYKIARTLKMRCRRGKYSSEATSAIADMLVKKRSGFIPDVGTQTNHEYPAAAYPLPSMGHPPRNSASTSKQDHIIVAIQRIAPFRPGIFFRVCRTSARIIPARKRICGHMPK
ncbi:uncharacterized protein CTRU02_208589 [Colletotrichum truncatum]|uniref:Uncharacterized protein n=1 Tax=Colletotrichum truncatum TaxID=5467 RepID=A0ACC3YWQ8_COLTU|nr:uncharacterized protein CTRU02_10344 [Colletotrichum truncatum]KAF6787548.1 hypothetical protein CTRU02_10344 [Colletotrichum truncatum]